ncbi:ABC transporter ATP-binding protein [Siccirubricoccus sp. KC 17139]|uniref:ABC transporter ATP-binding protein n=1 Tax=Siccirubricoccus soli TaxID=2899147 RepID=A0ABT1D3B9_9PROT|nr:ABC transporter ATP-binding protein [Siccirubricoccus soli]MCO6415780.1 ABC transporter ATP-binding protein [Siccirubricoccus soli]MCP2681912.1 ABC transporter ATP-binding protein [Siccirubricoccus soli]
MSGAAPLLELRALSVGFRGGAIQAVDGVDLAIASGETLAVVGESGSGKSVTALAILRLFGREDGVVARGQVLFQGEDLLALPEAALRQRRGRDIGIIFQDPGASLNPVFTVGEQVAEAVRRHQGLATKPALARALELLREVGLSDPEARLRSYPHQLSGGMRQRVMIAIALACAPKLLIADEPTTALDVTIQAQILKLLQALQARTGMALLFITHDLALVAEIADRIAVMYAGQVVESGRAAEVLARPLHPYTRALLACRPHRGPSGRVEFAPIPGAPPRGRFPEGCRFAARCALAAEGCAAPQPLLAVEDRATRCHRWGLLA